MRALALLLAVLAALTLASCASPGGGGGGGSAEPTQTTPPPPPKVQSTTSEVARLLDDWTDRLIEPYRLLRRRNLAFSRKKTKVALAIEPQLAQELLPLESWAREARQTLGDLPPTKPVRTAIQTGNAWSVWARTFRLDLRRGFNTKRATDVINKQRTAFRLQITSYVVAARPLPDAYGRPPLGLSAKQREELKKRAREAERKKRANQRKARSRKR
jgi:hypothetical protein